ncbi:MAG: metal-dependent hydrolase [Candidatus Woesearchaeota archaeon]
MMAKTHVAFGLLFGLASLYFVSAGNKFIFLGLAVFASLLPDFDHEDSYINNKLRIFRPVSYFFKHRGIFHTIWIPLAIWLVLWLGFGNRYGSAIFIGYFAHLFSDGLTKNGVNMIHPLSQVRFQGFIQTGGVFEIVVFIFILALDIVLALKII